MDQKAIYAATTTERLRLCDLLAGLDDAQWGTPSLCAGWTVRDVVAHLTTPTRWTVAGLLSGAVRARGDFHRMADQQARDRAATYPPNVLVAQLRETAGSARRMPGSAPLDPLTDVLVHGQDIVRPLGLALPVPTELAAIALDHVLGAPFTGAPIRAGGLRLVATDVDWSAGSGEAEVRGPAGDLLLTVLGRSAGLTALTGQGLGCLADRLTAVPA